MGDSSTSIDLAAASLTFSALSFLLLAVCAFLFFFPDFSATMRSGKGMGAATSSSKIALSFLGVFAPDIAILTGFFSDIMAGTFRYSVTSIISILTVILHWLIAGLVHGFTKTSSSAGFFSSVLSSATSVASSTAAAVTPPTSQPTTSIATKLLGVGAETATSAATNTASGSTFLGVGIGGQSGGAIPEYIQNGFNPCSIRGLGMFDNAKSPMGIAALTSIFLIYFMDMYFGEKRKRFDAFIYVVFSIVVYAVTIFAYKEFGCYGSTFNEVAQSSSLAILVGLIGGITGYYVLKEHFPTYLPLDSEKIGSPSMPGTYAKCNAPNSRDEFVCDAYKNGKRISTSIVDGEDGEKQPSGRKDTE